MQIDFIVRRTIENEPIVRPGMRTHFASFTVRLIHASDGGLLMMTERVCLSWWQLLVSGRAGPALKKKKNTILVSPQNDLVGFEVCLDKR